jgi:hypothetical protein
MFEQKKLNILSKSVHMPQKACPTTLCELIVIAALRQKQHKYRNLTAIQTEWKTQ